VFRRCDDAVDATETPIGPRPDRRRARPGGPWRSPTRTSPSCCGSIGEWLEEIEPIREFYDQFGEKLPGELRAQLDALEQRLRA
jgi:phosphoenolpyruvate carboxykinase (GTP)